MKDMVSKSHAKRRQDIKTKLMAAVAMLLVSSIMMVSTTYAWFTLSTAPEVTGISTQVGANGNLEMALMPMDGLSAHSAADDFGITSNAGDSAQAATIKNVTWGNLVDLSEDYGLEGISLYPSELNAIDDDDLGNPTTIGDTFLKYPSYGADGRVDTLLPNTVTSTFVNNEFPQNTETGVRAVGAASGMTERQLAYRNARSNASNLMVKATSGAKSSLQANGSNIANIVVKQAMEDAPTYDTTDVNNLLAICYDLVGTGANRDGGVYRNIEDAYKNYIIGIVASNANSASDTLVNTLIGVLEGKDLAGIIAYLEGENDEGYSLGGNTAFAELKAKVTLLSTSKAKVVSATAGLEALLVEGATINWGTISTEMRKIVDTDAMKINGKTAEQIKADIGGFAGEVMNGTPVATIASGGGVYADIADHCGDYQANVSISVKVQNTPLSVTANMQTVSDQPIAYLVGVGTAVNEAGAPQSDSLGAEVMPLSEFYGYIIDLAFRTNATTSDLCLQTEPIDRIYDDNHNPETMGGGSSMSFTSESAEFTTAQMINLMKAIRVVFFDPTVAADNILATAKLDMRDTRYTVENQTVTADLYLYEITAGETVTRYIPATHIADAANEGSYIEATADQTATHALVGTEYVEATYVVDDATAGTYKLADSVPATHVATEITLPAGEAFTIPSDSEFAPITSLTQGQAKAVSVLVYLDGNNITNADVAANTLDSMSGTLNLQFSSNANLRPMEYGQLIVEESERTEFNVTFDAGTTGVTSDITSSTKASSSTNFIFNLIGFDAENHTLWVKIGDGTAGDYTDYVVEGEVEIPFKDIKGDIVITITENTAAGGGTT